MNASAGLVELARGVSEGDRRALAKAITLVESLRQADRAASLELFRFSEEQVAMHRRDPDVATSWQSASGALGRWNTHLSHAAGWWPSSTDKMLTYPDLTTFLPSPLPATYGEVVDAL